MPFNEKFNVYILKCSDDTFYTGVTNDLEMRLQQHNNSEDNKSYTYSRRPVKVVWSNTFSDPTEAIAFEKRIKKWSQSKKLALIEGRFTDLPALAANKQKRDQN